MNNQKNQSKKIKINPSAAWLNNNFYIAWNSLKRLLKKPIATSITVTVLAIAMVLPISLQIVVNNVSMAVEKTEESIQLSLYLKSYVNNKRGEELAKDILNWPDIKNALFISPEEAKAKFEMKPRFSTLIENLPYNPLPAVIVLQLQKKSLSLEKASALKKRAMDIKEVDYVRLDLEWLQKINSLIHFLSQFTYGLSFLLILGMLLVVGNTIKLEVNARKDEIIVTKLIGGTHNFIRRPFIYLGFWLGLMSGVISILIVELIIYYLDSAILNIAKAYSTEVDMVGLSYKESIIFIFAFALLGWIGAWISATKQIRLLSPS